MSVSLRTSGPPEALTGTLREAIFKLDPALPISNISPVRVLMQNAVGSGFGLIAKIVGAISAAGLVLAAIGVYGVVSTFVVQRTSEIGIRMALGATASNIVRLVLGRTLMLGLIGAAGGALGALALLRVLGSLTPAMGGSAGMLIPGIATLVATSLIAAWFPLRRATKVDPIVALRAE